MSNQLNIPDRVTISCPQCGNQQLEIVRNEQGEFPDVTCPECRTKISQDEAVEQAKQAVLSSIRQSFNKLFKR